MATSKPVPAESADDKITIIIKTQDRNEEFHVDRSASMAELKPIIAERFNVEAQQLCLIYAGRLLADTDTLRERNVKNGFAIHLVIRSIDSPYAQQQDPARRSQHDRMEVPREARIDNGGGSTLEAQRINDIAVSLLSNPEYIRALISMDPRLQTYLDQNPEIAHAVNNPNLIREYLQIAANPNMMQEFLRNQDLTLRNLESMPGGFAALESIYNNLSEFESTTLSVPPQIPTPPPAASRTNTSTVPPPQMNNAPLPNPWSNEPINDARTPPTSMPPDPYPVFPVVPAPEAMAEMLANPQVQQLIQDLASDPNFLQNVVNNAPMLGDPSLADYLRTNLPNVLETLNTINDAGFDAAVFGAEGLDEYIAQLELEEEQQQQQQQQQPPQQQEGGQPEAVPLPTRYSSQLDQLNSMGFNDLEANLRALERARGDINAAIDLLTNHHE